MRKLFFTLTLIAAALSVSAQVVNKLVTASWKQSTPFNDLCPKQYPAGCGAIAVGQILNLYKMPAHGYGTATIDGVQQDLTTWTINWDNIRDSYSGSYTKEQGAEIAKLIRLVGAALDMRYAADGSSPSQHSRMLWTLQHYLHISPDSRYLYRKNYTTEQWYGMIDEQLAAGHPVFYRGEYIDVDGKVVAHMFVIDGKNADGLYHVNFGHASSTQDKYVSLNYINQSSSYYPGTNNVCYNHRQAMVINCYPVDGLTDKDYKTQALMLDDGIVINNDKEQKEFKTTKGASFNLSYTMRDCSMTDVSHTHYYKLGIFKDGVQIGTSPNTYQCGMSKGGNYYSDTKSYKIPTSVPDGEYELSFLYSSAKDDSQPWEKVWDCVPNRAKLTVKGNEVTITPTPNLTNGTLSLQENIYEIKSTVTSSGREFELKIANNSGANFEGDIILKFNVSGTTYTFTHTASIYEGRTPTFHIYVPQSKVPLYNATYSVEAYYKNTSIDEEEYPLFCFENIDTNGDGALTVADIVDIINKTVVGKNNSYSDKLYDLDGNGLIDFDDAAVGMRHYIGGRISAVPLFPRKGPGKPGFNGEVVDLGLSVNWATCNLGASSPEQIGHYFAWGETSPKNKYTWNTYSFYRDECTAHWEITKYCLNYISDCSAYDRKVVLDWCDDAAVAYSYGSMRMPTVEEMIELRDNCSWRQERVNGVLGYWAISKKPGYTDKKIFIPFTGSMNGTSLDNFNGVDDKILLWTSTLSNTSINLYAHVFSATGISVSAGGHQLRCLGMCIRPVQPK